MTLRISWFRLGLCLILVGAVFSVFGYVNWSSLASAYDLQCTTALASTSNCASISLSIGIWAPVTITFVVLVVAGLAVTFVAFRSERREKGTAAP